MTRSRKRKLHRCATKWAGMPLASAAFACGNVAFAQQASTGQEVIGLEEVIVTAQKRTEDLQKVPISLTVLGAEQLQQHQVASFDDFVKLLPSVSFQSLGPGQSQLYFRGVSSGTDGLHAGSVPAAGLYLDETPVTTVAGSLDIHMYDIQRVEALAGPQGTLYGASSLSGTLRIITNKPDPTKFSASYVAQANKYGDGDKGGAFEGYVNVPLTDHAAIRLVGYYGYDGGYISNLPGSVTYQRASTAAGPQPITFTNANQVGTNTNSLTTYGGRAALKFDFADTWSITPQYLYQYANTKGPFIFDPKVSDLNLVDFRPESNKDSWYQTALTIQGKIGNIDMMYNGGYFRRQVNNRVDYTGYTIGYDQNTTYGYTAFFPGGRGAPGPLGNQDPTQYTDTWDTYTKLTNEIRFSSPSDQRWRWLVGGYAQKQTDNIRVEFRVDGLPASYQVTGQGEVYYLSQQDRTDRDTAVFGDTTFDITDQFKLSAGMRYFWVDNTLFGFFGFNNDGYSSNGEKACVDANGDFVPSSNASNRPCINTNKKTTDSGETHRVNATYQLTPDKMVYATYSTGYRPGGNNRKNQAVPYQPDKLTNYEIGWKTSWDDNRVRFNGALFFEKWTDVQLAVQGLSGITSVVNVGNAETKGIEGEFSWLAMDHLTLSLSGTYVDAKTTTQFCNADRVTGAVTTSCDPADAVANVGTKLPVTPEFKGNLTGRYTFNVGGFDSFFQAAVFHQTTVTNDLNTITAAQMGDSPGFTTVDFSGGFGRDNWQLEGFIQNAFDERGELGRVSQCNDFAGVCNGNARVYPIKPQFFGIKFSRHF
jgi:iron complex outermembrane receptor protein